MVSGAGASQSARGAGGAPVLVFGAAGQLGECLSRRFADEWPVIALQRRDLDLANSAAVLEVVRRLRPAVIINCAGYNQVDAAEHAQREALEANAFAVRTLARAAGECDATLVHYSSDFVFDGESDRPYREDDLPDPRSVYAASKLLGEWFAADAARHYVLRVESLFGGVTRLKSSLDRILRSLAGGQAVRVFTDRVVTPSYVWDIVTATAALLRSGAAPGLYHCVNTGAVTWFEFAREAQQQLGSSGPLEPISVRDVPLPAPRPRYCALSNDKLRAAGVVMPTWQDALAREVARLHGEVRSGGAA